MQPFGVGTNAEQLSDEQLLARLAEARRTRAQDECAKLYKILASRGNTECEREWARIIEEGRIVECDLDLAMKYYQLAAMKNDAESAYRYSRLVKRTSAVGSDFWLIYAALLGDKNEYEGVAECFASAAQRLYELTFEPDAMYFWRRAAELGDTAAIVTMARNWYEGIATEPDAAYAKWYMDKLTLPPIYAIKLAYKLRTATAKEPHYDAYDAAPLLRRLVREARAYSFPTALHYLTGLLADMGCIESKYSYACQILEGVGCESDAESAIESLNVAALHGSHEAYRHLGDIYLLGEIVQKDAVKALDCYRHAARLGSFDAYERMGDVYYEGKIVERNVVLALELYDKGAKGGLESSKEKAERIRLMRKSIFEDAEQAEKVLPEKAFRGYAIATAMGYTPAIKYLARAYALGIGTAQDRALAYYWFNNAYVAGDEDAVLPLAICHKNGFGTEYSPKKAIALFMQADALGYEDARQQAQELLDRQVKKQKRKVFSRAMRLIHMKKFAPAVEYLDVCRRAGHPRAAYTLACMYEFGAGVECDRVAACRIYDEAFAMGFCDAGSQYKLLVLKMIKQAK